MSTLLMLDTTDNPGVFSGLTFDALAGYVGGHWPTYAPEVAAYPKLAAAHRVCSYAVNVDEDAELGDCEAGDMTIDELVNIWLPRQIKRGVWRPGVYANQNRWSNEGLLAKLAHYGPLIRRIVAHYDYKEEAPPAGYDCKQFSDHWQGRNIDANTCLESFFPAAEQPPHKNPPHYDWFSDGTFTSKLGNLNERASVEHYDKLRADPKSHGTPQFEMSRAHLRFLAQRVQFVAEHLRPLPNHHPDWRTDRRGWRRQQLARRAQGQRFV